MTAVNVDVYRYTKKIGSGSCTKDNAHLTSFTATYTGHAPTHINRFFLITLTSGTNAGQTFGTRFTTIATGSMIMKDVCPYS
jgi:hypothetical protein